MWNVRRTVATAVCICVVLSCIPWLRHQHFFSVMLGIVVIALTAVLFYAALAKLPGLSDSDHSLSAGRTRAHYRSKRLIIGFAIVLILIFTVPHYVATSSGAYKLAVATARESPQFEGLLGSPVKEGWYPAGELSWGWENPGRTDLRIPVKGSRRSGKLRVVAIRENGDWRLEQLSLEFSDSRETVDLLPSIAPPTQPKD